LIIRFISWIGYTFFIAYHLWVIGGLLIVVNKDFFSNPQRLTFRQHKRRWSVLLPYIVIFGLSEGDKVIGEGYRTMENKGTVGLQYSEAFGK
jgi:hypothetical protein